MWSQIVGSKEVKEEVAVEKKVKQSWTNVFLAWTDWAVFSDAPDWEKLKYAGEVSTLDQLNEMRMKGWKWWHIYNPYGDILIDFSKGRVKIQRGVTEEYKQRAIESMSH